MTTLEKLVTLTALILVILAYASASTIRQSKKHQPRSIQNNVEHNAFVVLGSTGDLAKREIYPALWYLYRDRLLPPNTLIYGYARSPMTLEQLREKIKPYVVVKPGEEKRYEEFWKINRETVASKDEVKGYDTLCQKVKEGGNGNRIFYLALPPSVFKSSSTQIKRACMADRGYTRIVVEKPFGHDLESSESLSSHLAGLFSEDQIYRIDHFLGYEVVQNILTLRFGNRLLYGDWNKENIASIEIDFKENFGIEGRGAFFDENGIIRDVMQNHLLQILSLIAMEKPKSTNSNDIRDEKVKLLRATREIVLEDVVLGQYVGNRNSSDPRERLGYTEESTVPKNSTQSTFAMTVLHIDNDRWKGVPFIIRAGKGLNVNQTEVIVQFKELEDDIFEGESKRNKLVIGIGRTNKSLNAKIMSKTPGFTHHIEEVSVDFNYDENYKNLSLPDAYERLILDTFQGSQLNFVRSDELREAWRIFTPILHEIESTKAHPLNYTFGTTGPTEADDLEREYNFIQ